MLQKGLRKEVRSDIVPAAKIQQQFFEQVVEGGLVLATRQSVTIIQNSQHIHHSDKVHILTQFQL